MTRSSNQTASHHSMNDDDRFTHWYQEPWAWYIVGVLVVTFCWGAIQVTTAIKHADEVVVDDYYKVGKAINQDLTRDKTARELDISAEIAFKSDSGKVYANLQGAVKDWPQQLRLKLLPAAPAAEKQTVALIQSPAIAEQYTGQPAALPTGRYFVQLETLDVMVPEEGYQGGWRLNREVNFAPDEAVEIRAYE
ncbi:FixH family protein [Sansalvadorimonas sp. 2012CJ34-2]|uniref:FixH family protein n=1 Tax=Parendozoicomonas callyspongiae TaxID=2942213 RepID=A0ABT0PIC4_9GAMM|nr:FixH family protein [Sansalvadorimonas sp. 2012CJ34-2]MCL6271011.1 FixH family protein [Sansalvadorimonas sp. 2012CJ34-2]